VKRRPAPSRSSGKRLGGAKGASIIENAVCDLKAVNPNAKSEEDTHTPEELMDLIQAKGREIAQALAVLRQSQYSAAHSGVLKDGDHRDTTAIN
jgi:type I restriction enzyme M protein